MAHIDIERKKTIWPWIAGLIILVLIAFALLALGDEDETTAPTTTVTTPVETPPLPLASGETSSGAVDQPVIAAPMPPPPTEADNAAIPVAAIVIGPVYFLGQPVVGTGQVAAVVSDRGFWLEQDGQRIFVMVAKSPPMERAVNVNPGQRVRLAGVIYNQAMASQITGDIEPDAMNLVADQPAFVLVNARNIALMEG